MIAKNWKHTIAYCLLLCFILIKSAGLHSFSHDDGKDDSKDCVWCHLVLQDQNTPVLPVAEVVVPFSPVNLEIPPYRANYRSVYIIKKSVSQLVNRPPPFKIA